MKRIGLIGGMSWESSALYYSLINELTRSRLGGLHSAPMLMASVDFAAIEKLQSAGEWDEAGRVLATEARTLEAAGVDFLVLCTNTMHKVADAIEDAVSIPLLHLGDITAEAVLATGIDTVGLLGTRFTMEESFYRDRLSAHGLTVIVPSAEERADINRIIFDELVLGEIRAESRQRCLRVIEALTDRGAAGVILGCTELELLVGAGDTDVALFPTTSLHADAAVEFALSDERMAVNDR